MKVRLRQGIADGVRPLVAAAARAPRLIVLMYHAITSRDEADAAQLTVSRARFADHMRWLKELGYPVVSLATAGRQLRAGSLPGPVVALTFDDGYRSFSENALPCLADHGYPATMFLVPGAMDGLAPRDALPERLGPLLSWSEARDLLRYGVTVGAHGMTHRKLSRLPPEDVRREASESKRAIEDHLGVGVEDFCYPFGSYDAFTPHTEAILKDLGFATICSTIAGHNRAARDAHRLRRLRVSWIDDSRAEIAKQCAGAYNWYALVQRAQAWRQRRRA